MSSVPDEIMTDWKRPDTLEGVTTRLRTPCGSMFVTMNECENKLCEIMLTLGKSGTCQNLLFRTISLLVSVMLQSGISREKIVKLLSHQMEGNCGNGKIYFQGTEYRSCIDFVFRRIIEEFASRKEITIEEEATT